MLTFDYDAVRRTLSRTRNTILGGKSCLGHCVEDSRRSGAGFGHPGPTHSEMDSVPYRALSPEPPRHRIAVATGSSGFNESGEPGYSQEAQHPPHDGLKVIIAQGRPTRRL